MHFIKVNRNYIKYNLVYTFFKVSRRSLTLLNVTAGLLRIKTNLKLLFRAILMSVTFEVSEGVFVWSMLLNPH